MLYDASHELWRPVLLGPLNPAAIHTVTCLGTGDLKDRSLGGFHSPTPNYSTCCVCSSVALNIGGPVEGVHLFHERCTRLRMTINGHNSRQITKDTRLWVYYLGCIVVPQHVVIDQLPAPRRNFLGWQVCRSKIKLQSDWTTNLENHTSSFARVRLGNQMSVP